MTHSFGTWLVCTCANSTLQMDVSRHKRVISHSSVTSRMKESCQIDEPHISHIILHTKSYHECMSHVTNIEWPWHKWICHVTYRCMSYSTVGSDLPRTWMHETLHISSYIQSHITNAWVTSQTNMGHVKSENRWVMW